MDAISKYDVIDTASFRYELPDGSTDPDTYVDVEKIQSMRSEKSLLSNTYVEVSMAGNHMIEAGKTINLVMPTSDLGNSRTPYDDKLSGSYLIQDVHHEFDLIGFSPNALLVQAEITNLHRLTQCNLILEIWSMHNFTWFQGVVESRESFDVGSSQIRCLGYHTEDTNQLSTEDLPWAYPVQPITSAAMSGIGVTLLVR